MLNRNSIQPLSRVNDNGVSWQTPALIFALIISIPVLLGLGYYFGIKQKPSAQLEQFSSSLDEHRVLLNDTRRNLDADLDVFTHRVGLLQAHITRLNALGTQLANMADINPGEFDFANIPPLGGADESLEASSAKSLELNQMIEKLELSLIEKEQQLVILEDMLFSKNLHDDIKPRSKPVNSGWISSSYGYRNDPFTGKRQFHSGIDYAGSKGTPILAAAGGVVLQAGKNGRYGLMVEIDHRNGYHSRYAHASEVLVEVGDVVKRGVEIAKMGSTGRSTGTHLHFEVIKDGKKINPSRLLTKKR
ncbi:MAG TPA: hypothetical protein DD827_08445 [Gammaproteobacteria bacterium]|jgi:murein DD-endopeptidase MepM/ murein hydrolase activator NlpD|nr:hypothetical protein [Gammaproteobacteria bacterium]